MTCLAILEKAQLSAPSPQVRSQITGFPLRISFANDALKMAVASDEHCSMEREDGNSMPSIPFHEGIFLMILRLASSFDSSRRREKLFFCFFMPKTNIRILSHTFR